MARKAKNTKTEVDLSAPLAAELEDKSSCYGKQYDATDKICAKCADNVTCSIYFMRNLNKKVIVPIEKKEVFLDLQDFDLVPEDTLLGAIKKGAQPINNVLGVVLHYAKSKDRVAAMRYINNFCKKNNLTFKDGKIYASI